MKQPPVTTTKRIAAIVLIVAAFGLIAFIAALFGLADWVTGWLGFIVFVTFGLAGCLNLVGAD